MNKRYENNDSDLKAYNIKSSLLEIADMSEAWMLEHSFPFWAENGIAPNGGFYERLTMEGKANPNEISRVRIHARQIFSFSLAAELNWERDHAFDIVSAGVDFFIKNCRRPDGLYGKTTSLDKGLVDPSVELYDCSFALLGLATAWRVFGLEKALEAGKELSQKIDAFLKYDQQGKGYKERLPPPSVREQNPHMHLCEASLAWYRATGDRASLKRASEMADFIKDNFFDNSSFIISEFYEEEKSHNNRYELGHLFEWVWIFDNLFTSIETDLPRFIINMYREAKKQYLALNSIPLSQSLDSTIIEGKQRTWGVTELLKANVVMARRFPSRDTFTDIIRTTHKLFEDHLDGGIKGAWIDERNPDGSVPVNYITSATGYHVYLALLELISFVKSSEFKNFKPK